MWGMELPHCPHCGRNDQVESRRSLILGPRDIPLAILFTAVVVVAGNALAAASSIVAVAVLIAIAPLFLSIFHKFGCERCAIEFGESSLPLSERRKTHSSNL